jgi:DNA-binding winged helix-turn-helix (wHTH) protein
MMEKTYMSRIAADQFADILGQYLTCQMRLQQQLKLVIQAYDRLAASCGIAWKPGASAEVISHAVSASGRVFSFGPFRLFPSQRLLLEGNRKVYIGSRAFDILSTLVERAGEVVGKDELIARVWLKACVDESNLKTQVSALRRALGEARACRHYIVTVSGRGYNFVAPVSIAEGLDGPDPRQASEHDHLYGEAQRHEVAGLLPLPALARVPEPCSLS